MSVIDYRGLPYLKGGRDRSGVDCLGLCVVAFAGDHGIELEGHSGPRVSAAEREAAEALFRGEFESQRWCSIARGDEREWDVAWFRDPKTLRPTHVGLVMKPGWMLHADEVAGLSIPEAYGSGPWARLLIGFQRNTEFEARLHAA